MTNQFPIFDRKPLIARLGDECFGEAASSAVIVGGCKVGKTYLLDHIYNCELKRSGMLYCRVNVDLLKATAPGGALSDHVFLRFFLLRLLEQIDAIVAQQKEEREEWLRELPLAKQKAAALAGENDPAMLEIRDKHLAVVSGYSQKLRGYEDLVTAADTLRGLTAPGKSVELHELTGAFLELQALRKRITLVIDDYDRMVRQDGFTDNLFTFLRGASNEQKIITLVSSRFRLMDLVSDSKDRDRKSLFNHFQVQRLIPFEGAEPEEYLDWLGRPDGGDGRKLEDSDKKYLKSIAGGCPHLLRYARNLYLEKKPTASGRRQFERGYLNDEFQKVFEEIWNICEEEEKGILRAVAEGAVVEPGTADRLEANGYLLQEGSRLVVFSTLFADYIKKRPKPSVSLVTKPATPESASGAGVRVPPESPVDCCVDIPYEVFPSVLFYAAPEFASLATFTIENKSAERQSIQISCEFKPHSIQSVITDQYDPGKKQVTLQVELREDFKTQTDPVWTRVEYSVILNPGAQQRVITNRYKRVRLLPRDHFLFARLDAQTKVLRDFSWVIAAWVNSQTKSVQDIKAQALKESPQLMRTAKKGEDRCLFVRERVAAIYQAVQESNIKYFDNAAVFHSDENDYMQRVQTCAQTVELGTGNCLDGSVLFASVLSLCGLEPGILLLPGHALVGWKVPETEPVQWDFLETTVVAKEPFGEAISVGGKQFDKVKMNYALPAETIADPKNFAILVDVHQAIEKYKITPV